MTDPMPQYHEFFNPVLNALRELGGSATDVDLEEMVTKLMRLPESVVNVPRRGTNVTEVGYRIAWARTYLKKYGVIENSQRGVWTLTEAGRNTPTVDTLEVRRHVKELTTSAKVGEGTPKVGEGTPTTAPLFWLGTGLVLALTLVTWILGFQYFGGGPLGVGPGPLILALVILCSASFVTAKLIRVQRTAELVAAIASVVTLIAFLTSWHGNMPDYNRANFNAFGLAVLLGDLTAARLLGHFLWLAPTAVAVITWVQLVTGQCGAALGWAKFLAPVSLLPAMLFVATVSSLAVGAESWSFIEAGFWLLTVSAAVMLGALFRLGAKGDGLKNWLVERRVVVNDVNRMDTRSRLKQLDDLRADGIVTDDEYATKRAEIVRDL